MKQRKPQQRKPHNAKSAFTLIETTISLALFTMMFASIFSAISVGHNIANNARDVSRVSQILQSEMETIRALNWGQLKDLGDWSDITPSGEYVTAYSNNYQCVRRIFDINPTQKFVVVYALWVEKGRNKSESYSTVITKDGLGEYYYRAF